MAISTPAKVAMVVLALVVCGWLALLLFGGQLRHAVGGEVLPGDRDVLDGGVLGR